MIRKFERNISSLSTIFDYISDFVGRHQIDAATAYTLNLVIEEIFTNLVKYDPKAENEIPISLSMTGGKIEVELINKNGHKYDITESRPVDTEAPLEKRPIGGLGVHLVRHLVDEVKYSYDNGTSVIRIIKYLEESSV